MSARFLPAARMQPRPCGEGCEHQRARSDEHSFCGADDDRHRYGGQEDDEGTPGEDSGAERRTWDPSWMEHQECAPPGPRVISM